MFFKIPLILLVLRFVLCDADNSNGFGDKYDWKNCTDFALDQWKALGKPIIVIIHKSWCPRCIDLAAEFAKSEVLLELSQSFVMLNCQDDDEPIGPEYAPDGKYIPRVLFFSKDGEPLHCVNRWGNPEYKYYFYDTKHIENCMREVLGQKVE